MIFSRQGGEIFFGKLPLMLGAFEEPDHNTAESNESCKLFWRFLAGSHEESDEYTAHFVGE